tara:strand:- start:1129 stop:1392 length:264 start_codon:yes stop_codon:yes gene_type:complete
MQQHGHVRFQLLNLVFKVQTAPSRHIAGFVTRRNIGTPGQQLVNLMHRRHHVLRGRFQRLFVTANGIARGLDSLQCTRDVVFVQHVL